MNWFYAYQGQRAGPVDDDEFARLVGNGTVADQTLVWRSGMADWLPFGQVRATPPTGEPAAGPSSPAALGGVSQAQCSQCGRVFPADEVIRLEGFNVCAACKPILLQKMRQGVSPAYGAFGVLPVRFGGFWIRVGASFLDALIMLPVGIIIGMAAWYLFPAALVYDPRRGIAPQLLYRAISFGVGAVYDIAFTGSLGGTPGKLICGLQVVRADGSRVTYGRATGRFFAKFLNFFAFFLSYLLVAFDPEKRGLHDHVADTRVVYKQ